VADFQKSGKSAIAITKIKVNSLGKTTAVHHRRHMAKDTAPRVPHRSFTVRIPEELYNQIGDLANADGMCLNPKVHQLLLLGLGRHVNLDAAVARLLKKESING
jgi:predicted HicB family RNase H-like nuclease